MQNLSKGVNVVSRGSPSRILSVLLISFGITILPKSSTRRTIPVAFIVYLSPFLVGADAHIRPRDGKPVPYNINFTNYAVSICKKKEIIRYGIKRTVYISINLAGILYSYIANNFNKSSAPKRCNDNSSTMTWSKNFFVLSSFNIVL